jgi:hypothetical protein
MRRGRDVGTGAERPSDRTVRWLGLSAGCLVLLSCAELLDIPDNPVLVDEPTSGVPTETAALMPAAGGNPNASTSAMGARGIAPGVGDGEAFPTSSLMSSDDPPIVVALPLGGTLDAGLDDVDEADSGASTADQDASTPCAGQRLFGICWYLGAFGESCEQVCSAHGGYADAATLFTGARAQGGSPEECTAILGVLAADVPARTAFRGDGVGVGCHTFGLGENPYWLTLPNFEPSSRLRLARIACGCVD